MSSECWPVGYAVDALNVLSEKERMLPTFHFQSPQLSSRQLLVKWLFHLGEQFNLGRSTVHLAVYILDRFMDGHAIVMEKINLTGLTSLLLAGSTGGEKYQEYVCPINISIRALLAGLECQPFREGKSMQGCVKRLITLAEISRFFNTFNENSLAKYEEREDSAPKIGDMIIISNHQYQRTDFLEFEGLILKYLDWNLSFPNAIKFVEYYSLVAVSRSDWDAEKWPTYQEFCNDIQRTIREYLDQSLEDVQMIQYKPSEVASSCIVLARRKCGVKPLWTPQLILTTRYRLKDILLCANNLLRFCMKVFKVKRKLAASPDQGYATEETNSPPSPKKVCCGHKSSL